MRAPGVCPECMPQVRAPTAYHACVPRVRAPHACLDCAPAACPECACAFVCLCMCVCALAHTPSAPEVVRVHGRSACPQCMPGVCPECVRPMMVGFPQTPASKPNYVHGRSTRQPSATMPLEGICDSHQDDSCRNKDLGARSPCARATACFGREKCGVTSHHANGGFRPALALARNTKPKRACKWIAPPTGIQQSGPKDRRDDRTLKIMQHCVARDQGGPMRPVICPIIRGILVEHGRARAPPILG